MRNLKINTHLGLYEYNRLVFGITSSPAIFQRIMDTVLSGLENVQCNQDDIIITGETNESHLKNIDIVLNRLEKFGLRANLKKCNFFQDEILFCGHKINKDGLHKTVDKVEAIINAPRPTNVKQLRSFLGMLNYYHKFLNNIATVINPLNELLQKNIKWQWSNKQEKAFLKAKELIAPENFLMCYDPKLPLRLACDASPYGLGAVLSHITDEGKERPIAYASRSLNKAEKNYSQIDKESLAIIYAVKKFFSYVCSRKFTLVTDHKPLQFIFGPAKGIPQMIASRLQRYAVFLSGLDYTIEYRSTEKHSNADCLSRLPLADTVKEMIDIDDLYYTEILDYAPISATSIRKETARDTILSQISRYINESSWPENANTNNDGLNSFLTRKHELSMQQGSIMWGNRVVIPKKLQT